MELSISILNSEDKIKTINELNSIGVDYVHLDIMDGRFVSQTSLTIDEIVELSNISNNKVDVHLMVNDPLKYIEKINKIENIEFITIHKEIDENIKDILSKIRNYGFKAGLSIKPSTRVNELLPYLDYIDLVLVMTVEPGLGGQQFIESSISKVKEVKSLIENRNIKIEVDGGINNNTINLVSDADIAVVGSYITNSSDINGKINSLLV